MNEQPIEKKKTNGARNRRAGHSFELEVVKLLKAAGFPHAVTCRSESRSRDNDGIDIINKNEAVNGRIPYNIQAKNYSSKVKYLELLNKLPKIEGVTNVVFHKMTVKKGVNFHPLGQVAVLSMEDFLTMASELKKLREELLYLAGELRESQI